MATEYAYDQGSQYQMTALEDLCDPATFNLLKELNLAPDLRCWEVGAGGGSVARWLRQHLGPRASITATDITARWLTGLEGVYVQEHDVRVDPPPTSDAFDLIIARSVLFHLPECREVLRRLVDALAPGGTIFLGDFDGLIPPVPVSVPEPGDADLITRFVDANWRALELHGAYRGWAREAPQELQHCGLIDIASHQLSQRAGVGSAGHRLLRANVRMLRSSLLTWMTADELDRLDRILDDPQTVMFSHSLVFSWGRKEL